MHNLKIALLVLITVIAASCNRKSSVPAVDLPEGIQAATVIEVKQTPSYTYLEVFDDNQKYWMATSATEAKAGDVVYFRPGFEMKDFKSKELNRTFSSIYFVQELSTEIPKKPQPTSPGKINPNQVQDLNVEKASGGISIAELYENPAKYEGKEVIIRGLIVKANSGIMGKNWAHIQDGSRHNENFDLTVTTIEPITEGRIVTFTGKISLNKDFGYGYSYNVLMEDAKVSGADSSL